ATCFAAGFFSEAEACYRQAAQMEPRSANLRYDWGFLLSQMGRIDDSNQQFQQALELGHPRPNDCWYFLGRNYLRLNQPENAAAGFSKRKELPANKYELARIYYRQGKLEQARNLVESLQAADPRAIESNFMCHRIELALANLNEADRYHELCDMATHKLPTP